MQFFMGLNESFSHIRGQILLLDHLPTINKVFSLVLREERQREITSATVPSYDFVALLTKTNNPFVPKSGSYSGKDRLFHSHYSITGYIANKCYRLHGFPLAIKITRIKDPMLVVILEVLQIKLEQHNLINALVRSHIYQRIHNFISIKNNVNNF